MGKKGGGSQTSVTRYSNKENFSKESLEISNLAKGRKCGKGCQPHIGIAILILSRDNLGPTIKTMHEGSNLYIITCQSLDLHSPRSITALILHSQNLDKQIMY